MSLIDTTSTSGCAAWMMRKTLRPMRPKPLIAMRMPMAPVILLAGSRVGAAGVADGPCLNCDVLSKPARRHRLGAGADFPRKRAQRLAGARRSGQSGRTVRAGPLRRASGRAPVDSGPRRPLSTLSTPAPRAGRARWRYAGAHGARWPRSRAGCCSALSGGADSVLLLHVAGGRRASAPSVLAVHVDHGLRGAESARDARFCGELCREPRRPLRRAARRARSRAARRSRRARAAARYRLLAEEARRAQAHARRHRPPRRRRARDAAPALDARHEPGGLCAAPAPRARPGAARAGPGRRRRSCARCSPAPRGGARAAAPRRGLAWREDSSNARPRFARNRVRHALLPEIERLAGAGRSRTCARSARAVEELEGEPRARHGASRLVAAPDARPRAAARERELGGMLARARS